MTKNINIKNEKHKVYYNCYLHHMKNGKYVVEFFGAFFTIRVCYNTCRNYVDKSEYECESFSIREMTIINCPNYSEVCSESRYIEVHKNGKINVYHKRRFL